MPRTKRPVSKKERKSVDIETLKEIDKIAAEQKEIIRNRAAMEKSALELAFKMLISSIPEADMKKTIGQLKAEIVFPVLDSESSSSRAASQDDGYLTENSSRGSITRTQGKMAPPPSASSRSVSRPRRSRSATRPPSARPPRLSRARSVYHTPLYKNKNTLPPITPKVSADTPLMLVRQVRDGEMVVSMSGSPVMPVNYMPREDVNCNIRLEDGTLLSVQPHKLRPSQAFIPHSLMGPQVWQKLEAIKNILDVMVKSKPQDGTSGGD